MNSSPSGEGTGVGATVGDGAAVAAASEATGADDAGAGVAVGAVVGAGVADAPQAAATGPSAAAAVMPATPRRSVRLLTAGPP